MPHNKRKIHDNPKDSAHTSITSPHQTVESIDQSQNSDDFDDDEQEIVNVDFEFFDPKAEDFHGVKALLRSYLDDCSWDIGGFVDVIVAQTTVGTVIKTGEDESPIGFITALNIGLHKDKTAVQNIFQYLERNCNAVSDAANIKAIFEEGSTNTALLVSERLINAPEELASPLYKGLFDEILWATEDEPTKELQDSFKFKHYLVMSRVFQQIPKKKKKGQKQKIAKINENNVGGDTVYIKAEDELLHQLSDWSCIFPVNSETLAAHEIQGLKQFRLVMLVSYEKMDVFKSQFCTIEQ